MVAKFRVQHEILSGLQYVQVVKRKGIRVSKDSEMMVLISQLPRITSLALILMHLQGKLRPEHRQVSFLHQAL